MICDLYNLEIVTRVPGFETLDKEIGSTHSHQTNSLKSGSSPSQ